MLVHEFLERSARRTPDRTALVCEGRRLDYAAFDASANRMAQSLIAAGVERGDRVVVHLPNSVAAAVAIFATLKAGGVFVPVNPTVKPAKLRYILADCGATGLVTRTRNAAVAGSLLAELETLRLAVVAGETDEVADGSGLPSFDELLATGSPDRPSVRVIDRDLACLIYTSGSTGDPKGVMCGHDNVAFAAASITTYLENTPDDVIINALPLSFDYGLYQLLMATRFGGTLVLEKSFAYPSEFLARIAAESVTVLPGVPTMFSIILGLDLSSYDLSSLRCITNTAAALPASHIEELRKAFPQARVFSMYGLTETKRTLYLPPAEIERIPGSVGIPIPGTEAWIVDDAGRPVAPGVVGELVVRGGHVMRGYWGNADATRERFRPGPTPGERVVYTGDLFRMDDDGYFYFVGRQDDIIKTAGEKVAPKEIENVLYELDGVEQAAVIGETDPVLGQAIKAFVAARRPISEAEVMRHCRARLEAIMVPHKVEFRDALPVNASGKIQKTELSSE